MSRFIWWPVTPDQKKRALRWIARPPRGSDLAKAKKFGVDLTLLFEKSKEAVLRSESPAIAAPSRRALPVAKVNLEETIRALFDANVEFVLIGGAAMQMQGSAHLTEDLDFCYSRSAKNLERLARAMAPHHLDSQAPRKICPFALTPPPSNAV